LPRQARDKHTEIYSKRGAYFAALALPTDNRPYVWESVRIETRPFKKTVFFLSFPYVCPEPVLVNRSFLYINGSKKTAAFLVAPCSDATRSFVKTGFGYSWELEAERFCRTVWSEAKVQRWAGDPAPTTVDAWLPRGTAYQCPIPAIQKSMVAPFFSAFPMFVPSLSW